MKGALAHKELFFLSDAFTACICECECAPLSSHEVTHSASGALTAAPKTEIFIFNKMFTAHDLFWYSYACCWEYSWLMSCYRNRIFIQLYLLYPDKFPSVFSHWFWLLVPPSGCTALVYRGITTLQSLHSLIFISPGSVYALDFLPHKEAWYSLFKRSRQLSSCRVRFIYITGRGHVYLCQSVQNYF